jgi:hypothetical protein
LRKSLAQRRRLRRVSLSLDDILKADRMPSFDIRHSSFVIPSAPLLSLTIPKKDFIFQGLCTGGLFFPPSIHFSVVHSQPAL